MCTSLTDYHMTYTSTEQVSEKYKIEHSVTIKPELEKHKVDTDVTTDKNRTNDIQRSEEEDKQQQSTATTNTVF
jgi:hypothetical protein